ncbi:MAG: MgtC/SapB family protein [Verrucomicrobia bacterium]|nr:MgtC/SapB family protein [Verrucomicrobiota bacterium]
MVTTELLKALLVSLCLGALIGLERQWEKETWHPGKHVLAGLRTFTFWSLLGTLCGYFTQTVHPFFFLAGFVAMAVWIAIFLFYKNRSSTDPGYTTGAVGLLTYLIGGLVAYGQNKAALILTLTVVILLALKPYVHQVSRRFSKEDVRMALQFAAITGVILPLVPDEPWGPYGAFNPHSIWLMVVLVSGASFGGYVAVRMFGHKLGIALTGLIGGIASSTATTLAMSKESKAQPALTADCAMAVVLACTVMLWRVAALTAVVYPPVLNQIIVPFLVMSGPAFLWCGWRLLRHGKGNPRDGAPEYRNPLGLRDSLKFAAFYALIVYLVKVGQVRYGETGIDTVSALSGLMDLDAISLSLTRMAGEGGILEMAVKGILIATVANTVVKAGVVAIWGSPRMRLLVLPVMAATAVVGVGFVVMK